MQQPGASLCCRCTRGQQTAAQWPELEICTELTDSIYSKEYVLYFMDPSKSTITDGMRVGVDPVCLDQRVLTEMLCRGKQVELVEFPFVGFEDITSSGKVDCVVFRDVTWQLDEKNVHFGVVPLDGIPGFSREETNTPVVLLRKGDYGIDRLMKKYLDVAEIGRIQKEVLSGKRSMKVY